MFRKDIIKKTVITLIADLSFLGALLSILVLVFPNFSDQLRIYNNMSLHTPWNTIINVITPIILLMAAYGFLKLKIWGYWLIVIYSTLFLMVYIVGVSINIQLIASQNFIATLIELVVILPTKKYFG